MFRSDWYQNPIRISQLAANSPIEFASILLFLLLLVCTFFGAVNNSKSLTDQVESLAFTDTSGISASERLRENVSLSKPLRFRANVALASQPHNIDSTWLATAQQQIAERQYNLKWQTHSALANGQAAWLASNRQNGFVTYFTPHGMQVLPIAGGNQSEPEWVLELSLAAAGAPKQLNAVAEASVTTSANRIEYRRGSITEWYINKAQGVEQGFTIHNALSGAEENLAIEMSLRGNVRAHIDEQENVIITDSEGEQVLVYGQLKVFDANGKSLASTMQADDHSISLLINVQGAQYPVVVDPLISNPATMSGSTFELLGPQAQSGFGWRVINAGDVDGDGFPELAVGAIFYTDDALNQADEGAIFVYSGTADGFSSQNPLVFDANQAGANMGYSLTSGDFNGDGYNDIAAGAQGFDNTGLGNSEGKVFVYFGSALGLNNDPALPMWTAQAGIVAAFGISLASADLNGDSLADLVVGASLTHNSYTDPATSTAVTVLNGGSVFVYYGNAGTGFVSPAAADWMAQGLVEFGMFGEAVASAGDVNGDGIEDLLIGAPETDNTDDTGTIQLYAGAAYVYHGAASGLAATANPVNTYVDLVPDWTAKSYFQDKYFGKAVASAGNFNGDLNAATGLPIDDIIIGAPSYESFPNLTVYNPEGFAIVYFGSSTGIVTTNDSGDWQATDGVTDSIFGAAVAGVGDINDDGIDDIIVGAPFYSNVELDEGAVYAYHGAISATAAPATTSPASRTESNDVSAYLGWWLDGGGNDYNNDGYNDILAGAWNYANNSEGAILRYNGGGKCDLGIELTAPSPVLPQPNTFNYLLTISNISNPDTQNTDVAHDVVVENVLPASVNFVGIIQQPADWNCGVDTSNTLHCTTLTGGPITMANGASAIVEYQVTAGAGEITNTATVSAANIVDNDLANNSASLTTIVNTPPIALPLSLTTDEDIAITNGAFAFEDPDPNAVLTFNITANPAQGTIINNDDGTFNYTPMADANGEVQFSFTVADQFGAVSAPAITTITINAINDAPVVDNYTLSVAAGEIFVADGISNPKLSASDLETPANMLEYSVATITLQSGNTVTINIDGSFILDASLTSTPPASESFPFTVTDNDPTTPLTSNPGLVTITYLANSNIPPIADSANYSTNEDMALNSIQLSASDSDGLVTGFIVDQTKTLGVVTVVDALAGTVDYQPPANVFGSDSFSFYVEDNGNPPATSTTATVTIDITSVNDAPSATKVSFQVQEDSQITDNPPVPLNGEDVDMGDILEYSLGSGALGPQMGTATLSANTISYVPSANLSGIDSFEYTVTDSAGTSATSIVEVDIIEVNDAPTISKDPMAFTASEDLGLDGTLTAEDIENNNLTFKVEGTGPAKGVVVFTNNFGGAFTYTPNPNANGSDTFTYTVSDDGIPVGVSPSATVNIDITPSNDAPIAQDTPQSGVLSVVEDSVEGIDIQLLASDPDLNDIPVTESLSFEVDIDPTVAPKKGEIEPGVGGQIRYLPNADATGEDKFRFTVTDKALVSSSAWVTINISAVNDAPSIMAVPEIKVFEDVPHGMDFSSFVSDIDSTVFTFEFPGGGSSFTTINNATVTITDATAGLFTYTSAINYVGPDSFEFLVTDQAGLASNTVTVSLVVNATQDQPIANDLTLELNEDQAITGKLSAIDSDGVNEIGGFEIVGNPAHGDVVITNEVSGDFTYVPHDNYFGVDSFTYLAFDKQNNQSIPATVTLNIKAENDAPEIDDEASDFYLDIVSSRDAQGSGKIVASDIDDTQLSFSIYAQASNGEASINSETGIYTYVTEHGTPGDDFFDVKIDDGNGGSSIAKVVVCVAPVNDNCTPLTNPKLVSPSNDQNDLDTTVTFKWLRAEFKDGEQQGGVVYEIIYCDNENFLDCSGKSIPKSITDKVVVKSSGLALFGGSSASLLLMGLLGSAPRRKRLWQAGVLLTVAFIMSACSEAVDRATPDTKIDLNKPVEYVVNDLSANTKYFWRVVAMDETSGKSAKSAIQNFSTK